MSDEVKKGLYLLPMIFMTGLIFYFSSFSGDQSSSQSDLFVKPVLNLFTLDPMTVTFVVRKLAHVLEYALLAFCTFFSLKHSFSYDNAFFIILYCYTVSFLDEIYQGTIPGRNGNLFDTLVDLIGILLVILWLKKDRFRGLLNKSKV